MHAIAVGVLFRNTHVHHCLITRRQFLAAAALGMHWKTAMASQRCLGCASADSVISSAEDLSALTAESVVAAIHNGELRAEVYVAHLLKRYRSLTVLHCVTRVQEDRLLEQARRVDHARQSGARLGALSGLPIVVKDNINTIGFPTAAGTRALNQYYPRVDACVVEALFRHGALLFGKSNMHELAMGGTSANPVFGVVRNPYDMTRIPGGSSGGTAAAIAAGIVPAGLGTDTAGSVRMPAAMCGIVGFRPTVAGRRKRYSDSGVVPLSRSLDTVGTLARTVTDIALLDWAVTGKAILRQPTVRGLRLGRPRGPYWEDLEPAVRQEAERACDRLKDLGAVLVDTDLRDIPQSSIDLFGVLMAGGRSRDLADFLAREVPGLSYDSLVEQISTKYVKAMYESRSSVSRRAFERARTATRPTLLHRYTTILRSVNIVGIVFPTTPLAAPKIRWDIDDGGDRFEFIRNTAGTAALGVPGLTIPIGLTREGLPVGLEIDALPGQDRALLAIGVAIQEAIGAIPLPRLPPEDVTLEALPGPRSRLDQR